MAQGQGAEPKVDGRRFAAFISYSHADKEAPPSFNANWNAIACPGMWHWSGRMAIQQ